MTCIVGVTTPEGTVSIGGDSAITDSTGVQTILARKKIFFVGSQNHRLLLGCTTSCRMIQLLQFELQVPPYDAGMDEEEYLVIRGIPAIRACFKQGGFARIDDEKREEGGHFLLGFRGRLFEVQSNYQLCEPSSGYEAVGSGATFALGALYMTPDLPVEPRIEHALAAAAFHTAYVRPPFFVEHLPFPRDER